MKPANKIAPEVFFIDKRDRRTLQMQLATSIISTILDTQALPGTRMPSTRTLAETLGVSRLTVSLVYQDLSAQGYLDALPRSGFAVAKNVPHRRVESSTAARGPSLPVDWNGRIGDPLHLRRNITKPLNWRSFPYPFIYGQVDPRLFDHNAWRDCARRALGQRDFLELADDRMSQDDPVLVDYIRRNSLPRRGIHASPDEILVTLGAQNALWIAATLLARPDKLGVMEDPGFPDFAEILRFLGMPRHYVPCDDDGLNPELIPANTGLVIATPSHNVPTGATMPRDRRRRLLDLADEKDFIIIEDDYETEMNFQKPPTRSLMAMDTAGRVIYVGSLSKSLFPGLRIGYLVAPPAFINQARELRALMLRHAPGHMQRIAGYFLALGHYDSHVVRLRETLRLRREALVKALEPTDFSITGVSRHGGSSLWVSGPSHIDSRDLAAHLEPKGVLIEPGHPFFANPPQPCSFFRLGYSSIDENQIAGGVRVMQTVVREMGV